MVGSGKNWERKLTMPSAPKFTHKEAFSLDKVKNITKPVIRNGEIVRDAQVFIPRHLNKPISEATAKLYAIENKEALENANRDESLYEEGAWFESCVEDLHGQIQGLFD